MKTAGWLTRRMALQRTNKEELNKMKILWKSATFLLLITTLCVWPITVISFQNSGEEIRSQHRSAHDEEQAVKQLLQRLIPEKAAEIQINVDYDFDNKDAFQISTEDGKVLITGTRGYAAAAGVYHYLKVYCGCHVSWSGNQLRLPEELPKPTEPVKITFNDKYRYYQNVCTSSYSFVWWDWERWEKEIDWMALNGINLALAFNAQEAIFYKVFKQLNFTDHDIEVFLTGPAFLAWNRMGNMQLWVGPLSENWHKDQTALQHKILNRMRDFGMTSVLPAFSGRVIPAFRRNFPDAQVTVLNRTWAHFQQPYGFVSFLQPTDPIFQEIGSQFLRTYIEEFGTDHIYSADLFNEMPPPSTDPDYLQSCAKSVYKSLIAVDPDAIWMTQGWMFYNDPVIWQPAQASAFLRAVPLGKMIILDLQSELYPQYHRLSSYYGQPFIWCMLHNYGGVTGLYGSLDSVNVGPFEGRTYEGSTMVGTGLTPEGIETNDIAYELMNEMGWRKSPVDLHEWLGDFARRRYGEDSSELQLALLYLRKSVYNASDPYRNHGKYILIRRPSLKLKPYIWYDPENVFTAWDLYMNASYDPSLSQSPLFRHDLVDLTRQSLQLVMDVMYPTVVDAFKKRNLTALREISKSILELYDDMDELLASDEHFLLGRWIRDAVRLARTPLERRQYEYNARNQITLWGPAGELVDYANKQWAGLISKYYKKRWQFFFETLEKCIIKRRSFKQADFNKAVYQEIEYKFDLDEDIFSTEPEGDPIEISRRLFAKYRQTEKML
ncbi:alpha-N-acetylglucosaminidase [Nephila pilipes]|uniref:Alpha-N-acetylglucosaminidase n=1 Tax=Nephila pilipes TaxID=299642 RepID=A0A8X6PIS2_NEPPI|nr:alpha-N-acetylglucosaminidase [Nephila pilipes]